MDLAVHHVDVALRDSHTEARTLIVRAGTVTLLREFLVEMLLVLFTHADASVRDAVVHLDVLPVSDRLVLHLEADRATILRELDGVTEDVDQHLADAELVCVNILRRRRGALDDKLDIPPLQEAMGYGQ